MKQKKYAKPALFIEDLAANLVISTACNSSPTHDDGLHCSFEIPGLGTVFTMDNAGCSYTGIDDYVCYHNPADAENVIFTS